MNKLKEFKSSQKPNTITVNEALELSGLHSQVATNTSEIKILKEQTSVLDGVRMEVAEIKLNQKTTNDRLDKLDQNDGKIEKGIVTFRYWLAGTVVLVFSCIFGTLSFGVDVSRSDQDDLRILLETKIEASDKKHDSNYKGISSQLDDMKNILLETKPKQ